MRIKVAPLSIIVGVDTRGGFGKEGKIPWNIPEDMKHFKKVTKGGVCIMGRRTYTDMLEMVQRKKKDIKDILPGRQSFVVTSDEKFKAEGAAVVKNIREAVQSLDENDKREVFVLGGYRMFVEALGWANKIYMTIVKGDAYGCDVFFPINSLNKFKITDGSETEKMYFVTYER